MVHFTGHYWSPHLNFSVNDLDDRTEYTLNKFADYKNLGGGADIAEGHAAIQKKWATQMGQQEPLEVQQGEMPSPELGKK